MVELVDSNTYLIENQDKLSDVQKLSEKTIVVDGNPYRICGYQLIYLAQEEAVEKEPIEEEVETVEPTVAIPQEQASPSNAEPAINIDDDYDW